MTAGSDDEVVTDEPGESVHSGVSGDVRAAGDPVPETPESRSDLIRLAVRPLALWAAVQAGMVVLASGIALLAHKTLEHTLTRWDGGIYLTIAQRGYQNHLPPPTAPHRAWDLNIAFFPLFPALIRLVHVVTHLGIVKSGFLVAEAGALAGALMVWYMVHDRYGLTAADRATALVVCFPGAFILSTTYSETLLIPLVAGCLIALHHERWVLAGVLAGLSTAVDPTAIAVVVPCVVAAVIAITRRREWTSLAAPLLSPAGYIAYMAYLWAHVGSPLAWFRVERRGWGQHTTLAALWDEVVKFAEHPFKFPDYTTMTAGIVVAAILLVVAVRARADVTWLSYGAAVFVLPLLSAQLGFRPRIVLHAFPLIAMVGVVVRRQWFAPILILSAFAMAAVAVVSLGSLALTP